MNILVIDTATEACSAALSLAGKTYSRFEICPQQHSQRLLPMVDELLSEAGADLEQLDVLGFGRGPGSFTGVRIATGMIQGLALGSALPVVGVSTLAAMAQQAFQLEGCRRVAAAIDARMDEVYWGCFEESNGLMRLVGPEAVLPPPQARLPGEQSAWTGVGSGWQAYSTLPDRARVRVQEEVLYPCAEYMLPLVASAFAQGRATSVEDIQPIYLRDKVTWKKLPGRE
ncbi:tRNA (adenosine(37)-N6)-threonylcarbamoyltransferase complex dimerization subunit type 1 TsaB [Bowmanella dokdonensis]|uniref:tRNA threonylcarbamoyladenosine biosynthesis protein TsaB n=1 Tax=Bowmanella dokdonensis TaxID=751969 RepID=A0A939DLM1_9ALTE|nr:tRNA (adenosine(37)-N6)-threonylcarbamoyltransferase complex dimerization subunit type 1 TsaB [Bowmanella dokdonensis]MBN7825018.1 tRNA (adenosine(37)-N6)-threonylcarbamoyltransferase complex dimerization subunit type 1 TsaB [Bowmanella dokdonensis]